MLVGLVGCEIRLCAFVRPRVPCVPCVSRLPPVSFYPEPAEPADEPAEPAAEPAAELAEPAAETAAESAE